MTTEIVKVEAPEGLAVDQVNAVKEAFKPTFEAMGELEPRYKALTDVKLAEPTIEQCNEARAVRLLLVKTRTGTAKTHKGLKAEALEFGRYLDGMKKAQEVACTKRESDLLEIENYQENIERQRLEELQAERAEVLERLGSTFIPENLSKMSEDEWEEYHAEAFANYNRRKAEAKKAEEDRIAKEKADAEERERERIEQERVRKENERLKAEAAERERIEEERIEKESKRRQSLLPFIKYIRDYDAVMSMSDGEFLGELNSLSAEAQAEANCIAEKEEADRKENERLENIRRQQEAKLQAEREERERLEQEKAEREEQERKAAAEKKAADEAEAKRVADEDHRCKVASVMAAEIVGLGATAELAMKIVNAIDEGEIKNLTINY